MSENCIKYEFIKDKNNIEIITCSACSPGYYLNSENKCISFMDKINLIQNCKQSFITLGGFHFTYFSNNKYRLFSFVVAYGTNNYKEALKNIKFPISSTCLSCEKGYTLYHRECHSFEFEKCKFNDLIKSSSQQFDICEIFCNNNYNYYPFIYFKLENNSLDLNIENYKHINFSHDVISLADFVNSYGYSDLNNDILDLLGDFPICYNISNEDLKNKYQYCKSIIYIPINQSYICFECRDGYYFDDLNKNCFQNYTEYGYSNSCSIDYNSPTYSCQRCYYSSQILVTFETGIKECINDPL